MLWHASGGHSLALLRVDGAGHTVHSSSHVPCGSLQDLCEASRASTTKGRNNNGPMRVLLVKQNMRELDVRWTDAQARARTSVWDRLLGT